MTALSVKPSWGSKDYIVGFHRERDVVFIKRLNIFQRIVRCVFGAYADTHWKNVKGSLYRDFLTSDFPAKTNQRRMIHTFLAKAPNQIDRISLRRRDTCRIGNHTYTINTSHVFHRYGCIVNVTNDNNPSAFVSVRLDPTIVKGTLAITEYAVSQSFSASQANGLQRCMHIFLSHVVQQSNNVNMIFAYPGSFFPEISPQTRELSSVAMKCNELKKNLTFDFLTDLPDNRQHPYDQSIVDHSCYQIRKQS